MPALLAAFLVSLGLHATALFVPEIDLAPEPEAPALVAELRAAVPEPPRLETPEPQPPAPAPRAATRKAESAAKAPAAARPASPRRPEVLAVPATPESPAAVAEPSAPAPGSASAAAPVSPGVEPEPGPAAPDAAVSERLPPRGSIRFRVDRGDSGFEIGVARQEWILDAGRYRLTSSVETTGLAWLIRAVNIDMESVGRISADGLHPEVFGVMRSGKKARERALFDWDAMKVRVSDNSDHALDPGAQDLLSFYYQLGFLDIAPGQTGSMPLATGKKYGVYRLENLGDETIEIPLGVLRTRHLRTPGENATEIWLAYEYRLLPVKIRHVDNKGNAFVQLATDILFGQ